MKKQTDSEDYLGNFIAMAAAQGKFDCTLRPEVEAKLLEIQERKKRNAQAQKETTPPHAPGPQL